MNYYQITSKKLSMKKLLLLSLAVFTFMIQSCSSSDDERSVATSQFAGNWSGTFTGTEDNGTWDINISTSGVIVGTAISDVYLNDFDINGSVTSSGVLSSTFGTVSSGSVFNGQMDGVSNTASGTWINIDEGINGAWTGNKN